MQNDLFSAPEVLVLDGAAELHIFRRWMDASEAGQLLEHFAHAICWEQPEIRIGAELKKIPRLQAWYGDADARMHYSGKAFVPRAWTSELLDLKTRVEHCCEQGFNSVLLNCYRDQRDSVAWHADDEEELGENPVIASLSLGESRRFLMRQKRASDARGGVRNRQLDLQHGDLLVMGRGIQRRWQHCVPKESGARKTRINLTFRQILIAAKGRG